MVGLLLLLWACNGDPVSTADAGNGADMSMGDAGVDLGVSTDLGADAAVVGDASVDANTLDAAVDAGPPAAVTGTFGGEAFTAVAGEHSAEHSEAQDRAIFTVAVANAPSFCTNSNSPNAEFISVSLTFSPYTVTSPPLGTYTFTGFEIDSAPEGASIVHVSATHYENDALCDNSYEIAASGSLTITEWTDTNAAGSLSVYFETGAIFDGGSAAGSFTTPLCPSTDVPACPEL